MRNNQFNEWAFLDKYLLEMEKQTKGEILNIIECNLNILKNLRKQKNKGNQGYDEMILKIEVFNSYYRIKLRRMMN